MQPFNEMQEQKHMTNHEVWDIGLSQLKYTQNWDNSSQTKAKNYVQHQINDCIDT